MDKETALLEQKIADLEMSLCKYDEQESNLKARIADLEMQVAGKQMIINKEFQEEVKLEPVGMCADRKNIAEALEYARSIWRTFDESDRMYIEIAFYVFWNTLANHYTIIGGKE